jgi:hypothetical protein
MSNRYAEMNSVLCPVRLINLFETLSESVDGDPDDGVGLRIKIAAPSQCLHGDRIFVDPVGLVIEISFAYKAQYLSKVVGAPHDTGAQQPFEFFALWCELRLDGVHRVTILTLLKIGVSDCAKTARKRFISLIHNQICPSAFNNKLFTCLTSDFT